MGLEARKSKSIRKEVVGMVSGLAGCMAYVMALVQAIGSHMFVTGSQGVQFQREFGDCGEWQVVSAKLPELSSTGRDMVDALVTICCNTMTFLAQLSTLLPAQPTNT